MKTKKHTNEWKNIEKNVAICPLHYYSFDVGILVLVLATNHAAIYTQIADIFNISFRNACNNNDNGFSFC